MNRLYYILGLSAIIAVFTASLLSIIVYIVHNVYEYLYYGLAWFILGIIDYIVWRGKWGREKMYSSYCSDLRESAELIAILNTLVSRRDEYVIAMRVSNLLDKKDRLGETINSICGEETYTLFSKAVENPEKDDVVVELLKALHECMVNHKCESNVSLEE